MKFVRRHNSGHPSADERESGGMRRTPNALRNSSARFCGEAFEVRGIPALSRAGFTLAEVLAALVFLAILIPVALEALNIASRAGEVAARKSEAALVAEAVLNESIVTTNWSQTAQSGVSRQGLREFRWELRNEPWNQDPGANTMRQLTAEVFYNVQGREQSVRLSTLLDGSPPETQSSFGE